VRVQERVLCRRWRQGVEYLAYAVRPSQPFPHPRRDEGGDASLVDGPRTIHRASLRVRAGVQTLKEAQVVPESGELIGCYVVGVRRRTNRVRIHADGGGGRVGVSGDVEPGSQDLGTGSRRVLTIAAARRIVVELNRSRRFAE